MRSQRPPPDVARVTQEAYRSCRWCCRSRGSRGMRRPRL